MAMRDNGAVVGAFTLIGGAILGAGIALLFAPRSGKDTRREINLTARKTGRSLKRAARDFSDGVYGLVDELETVSGRYLDKGRDVAHGAKEELIHALEAGRERLGRQREKLADL